MDKETKGISSEIDILSSLKAVNVLEELLKCHYRSKLNKENNGWTTREPEPMESENNLNRLYSSTELKRFETKPKNTSKSNVLKLLFWENYDLKHDLKLSQHLNVAQFIVILFLFLFSLSKLVVN